MTQKIRKDGFPALACSNLKDPALISSSLLFRSNSVRQATLCLKSVPSSPGGEDAQTFILQINPGDLAPDKNSLTPVNIPLPQERLDIIQRQSGPDMRTLSLTFQQRCTIWYPKSILTTPTLGSYPALDHLASLAAAPALHISFDSNWVGVQLKDAFKNFIYHPERLSSFPVETYYQKEYERLEWALFNAPAYCDPAKDEDPAPQYPGATVKRLRGASNSTPSPPPAKRPPTVPTSQSICQGIHPTSPLAKDSMATPHLKPKRSSRASTAILSSSPSPFAPQLDIQRVVDDAIELSLTRRLPTLIPSLLTQLVTAPSPTPSQESLASQISTAPPPPQLTPFGESLGDYVTQRISNELNSIYSQSVSHGNFLRNMADDRFQEMIEGETLALERTAESTFEQFKQNCEELEEAITSRVEWRLENLSGDVEEHLGEPEDEGAIGLQCERKDLRKKRAELSRKSAELSMQAEELQRERAEISMERRDLRRERAELRKEKDELRREKRLLTQPALEVSNQERISLIPELPNCCVLP